MNVKLKVLRKVLEEAIANIDAGNSNHNDDELDDIISSLTKLNIMKTYLICISILVIAKMNCLLKLENFVQNLLF